MVALFGPLPLEAACLDGLFSTVLSISGSVFGHLTLKTITLTAIILDTMPCLECFMVFLLSSGHLLWPFQVLKCLTISMRLWWQTCCFPLWTNSLIEFLWVEFWIVFQKIWIQWMQTCLTYSQTSLCSFSSCWVTSLLLFIVHLSGFLSQLLLSWSVLFFWRTIIWNLTET